MKISATSLNMFVCFTLKDPEYLFARIEEECFTRMQANQSKSVHGSRRNWLLLQIKTLAPTHEKPPFSYMTGCKTKPEYACHFASFSYLENVLASNLIGFTLRQLGYSTIFLGYALRHELTLPSNHSNFSSNGMAVMYRSSTGLEQKG